VIVEDNEEHQEASGELDRKRMASVDMDELTDLGCMMAKVIIRLLRVFADDTRNTM